MLVPELTDEATSLLARLEEHEDPETAAEVYDSLGELVIQWARLHPEPVPHRRGEDLAI